MNKNELVNELCKRTDLRRTAAINAVEAFTDIIADAIKAGDSVTIRGFGTFKVYATKQRTARNIHKGTTVVIPERNKVKFVPSKDMKAKL